MPFPSGCAASAFPPLSLPPLGALSGLVACIGGAYTAPRLPKIPPPGDGCSFGNAGGIAFCEVTPTIHPRILLKIPGWLLDPLGPLTIRWSYLPRALPWPRCKILRARAFRGILYPPINRVAVVVLSRILANIRISKCMRSARPRR